jgi:5-methylthioadenosine/S-adenosylhomocysteine deaminase
MKILIKNADIITLDDQQMLLKSANIAIEGNKIIYVGQHQPEHFTPDKTIDGANKLVMPGLINAHTHSPMSLLRNYADDMSLQQWLFKHIIPRENQFSQEDIYNGAMLGIAEMIKSGTTCFADMYLHMDEVAQAVTDSGIRALLSKGSLISAHRDNNKIIVDEIGCKKYFNQWHNSANGRITTCLEIHSVYFYDETSLRAAAELAKHLNTIIHIHLMETEAERDISLKMYNKTSVEACVEFGLFDVPVIAAHGVHLSTHEMKILQQYGVSIVHNPSSNLKLGSGIADIKQMQTLGINIALGTDGAASNNNVNMFEEMHLAALLHKGVKMDSTILNAESVLKMATINGAKALGLEQTISQIAVGMHADLIMINMDELHLLPLHNHISSIVYSVQASDVDTVIIDGNIVMEKRELLTVDEEKIKYFARKIC